MKVSESVTGLLNNVHLPGRNPASIVPSKTLQIVIVTQLFVKPMPINMVPKLTPRNVSQFAAPAFGRTMF
jgi:hypothetical protein